MKEVFFLLFLVVCGNIYGDTASPPVPNRPARTCDGYAGIFLTGKEAISLVIRGAYRLLALKSTKRPQ